MTLSARLDLTPIPKAVYNHLPARVATSSWGSHHVYDSCGPFAINQVFAMIAHLDAQFFVHQQPFHFLGYCAA